MLVILIVAAAYFTWLGFALRKINKRYALLAWFCAGLLIVLVTGGFFGLI